MALALNKTWRHTESHLQFLHIPTLLIFETWSVFVYQIFRVLNICLNLPASSYATNLKLPQTRLGKIYDFCWHQCLWMYLFWSPTFPNYCQHIEFSWICTCYHVLILRYIRVGLYTSISMNSISQNSKPKGWGKGQNWQKHIDPDSPIILRAVFRTIPNILDVWQDTEYASGSRLSFFAGWKCQPKNYLFNEFGRKLIQGFSLPTPWLRVTIIILKILTNFQ